MFLLSSLLTGAELISPIAQGFDFIASKLNPITHTYTSRRRAQGLRDHLDWQFFDFNNFPNCMAITAAYAPSSSYLGTVTNIAHCLLGASTR